MGGSKVSVEKETPIVKKVYNNIDACIETAYCISSQITRLEETINHPEPKCGEEDASPQLRPPPMIELNVRSNDLREYLEGLLERLTLTNNHLLGQ